jgi:3-methyladenine DNA glycosylase AlkD
MIENKIAMNVKEIMAELKAKGSENIKKILAKHGVREPFYGVKVEHLKLIQKKIKKDHQLAKDLYDTGNADAMYLAGLIADDMKMTKADLRKWVSKALSTNISEYTVPWVAAEGHHGYELALEWIESREEHIAASGWATLASLVALRQDGDMDLKNLKTLLGRVVMEIPKVTTRVRHTMNSFVIAVGVYVKALTEDAVTAAKKIQAENKEITSRLPDAVGYILKMKEKGSLGKKKKTVKC